MRVTILNQFYAPDLAPTAHLSASLAEHLASRGDEVRVIASRGGYVAASESADSSAAAGPRVFRIWTPRLGKSRHLFRIADYAAFYMGAAWKILTSPRQDVIVTLTTPPLIGLTAAGHKLLHRGTKAVLWNMDCYPDVLETTGMAKRGGLMSGSLASLVRLQFRWTDHLVTLDQAMSDLLLGRYLKKGRDLPTTIVPNWEKADLFPRPNLTPQPVSAERPFLVLYLGNAGFGHRFDTVLAAAKQLQGEPIQFLFVGGGRRWDDIRTAADEAGLTNVEMRGYIPKEETPALLASADAALITLDDSSLGIMSPSKLHSNLASGLPIVYVGPINSNVDEAIRDFDCGVSLRHGETDALVQQLRSLLSDSQRRAALRQNARRAFDERYNDGATLPRLAGVIDAVAAG